jgi:DNA (cytosine-5)-methyltransferase 1
MSNLSRLGQALSDPRLIFAIRPLSVQEYAAIQTYPDWFRLEGNLAQQFRQLGNAVPTLFAEVVARHLKAFDEQRPSPNQTQRLRFSRYVDTDHTAWRENLPLFAH